MKRHLTPFLILLFVLGFIVRLYRFDSPVADWHAFRQGDTNAVSEVFAREGINLLYPKYFDISNVQSGKDNPQGLRMVEFPLYNALQAFMFGTFRIFSIEQWGRLISIFATLAGAFFIYSLTRKYSNEIPGILAAFFYLFIPYSIFYGRTILPDPSMTAAILAGIYYFDKWLEDKSKVKSQSHKGTSFLEASKSKVNTKYKILNTKYFVLATFFTALALLIKPFAVFFTIPMIYLAWKSFGFSIFRRLELWLFAALVLIPFVLWRFWISQFPEGIPASAWLLNGNGIRFRPSFFRWIFFERITKLIAGSAGIIFLFSGVAYIYKNKNSLFFLSFIVSALLYLSVIATGNVQHDYYQILIIPTVSMISGLGFYWIHSKISKYTNVIFATGICLIILIISLFYSWKIVRDYFNINDRGMVAAGIAADTILPPDAIVIAPHDNSTTFLNIIGRRGWPVFQNPIEELIEKGAQYLVIANPTKEDFEGFGETYKRVAEGKDYLILKLKD